MKEWYSKNKVSSKMKGDLTKERLRGNKLWPKLKAQAAATRHLAAYALYLIIEFGTPNDDEWGEHDTMDPLWTHYGPGIWGCSFLCIGVLIPVYGGYSFLQQLK
jgi:hypothetical protein